MKTGTTFILSLTAILILAAGSAIGKYSGGSGTAGDPYKIATKADLLALAANTGDYGNCFILTADINMGGQVFTTAIIAADNSFTGTFDGNDHKITNFTINGGSFVGLFGYIDSGGNVKNLGLENCSVNGDSDSQEVGGLVGENYYGSISNCYSRGTVNGSSGSYDVGGLVGDNESSISNCYSTGTVSGDSNSQIGGLVGYNDGTISDCNSTATISGGPNSGVGDVGGLVGENESSISNCYSTGAVSGGDDSVWLGGLVGDNGGNISNCYSTGAVSGFDTVGGLVGENESDSSISSCYSASAVNGFDIVGGLVGDNDGNISNCYLTGAVSGFDTVGGLVGDNESDSSISNCYSTGAVNGFDTVGGLVGDNDGNVSNCYSMGAVSGFDTVGGLVGDNESDSSISNCYSTSMVSASSDVGGIVGYNDGTVSSSYFLVTSGPDNGNGAPLTDAQMKQQNNFVDWDFDDIWHICETTNYPKLIWQIVPGDFVCPDGVNFADYSFFAERWHTTGCNSSNNFCGGADMDSSGKVDMADLEIFASNWLSGE